VPDALSLVNQRNIAEWTEIRLTQADAAYHERISHDINAAVSARDSDGLVAFYQSDIGRAMEEAADQAEPKFHDALLARAFAATERIKAMAVVLRARLKAAN
jgi:hypothetical protein